MKQRITRLIAVAVLALGASAAVAPAAQAAPECKGVIQCWDERVRECIQNLTLPPGRC